MSDCNCNEGGICHPCYDVKCEEAKELKALFKRYIDHVGDMEGVTFIRDIQCDEDRAKIEDIEKGDGGE